MHIDTDKVLRPLADHNDEELEQLDTLIRQEQETRVKLKLAKNEFPVPTVKELQNYITGNRFQSMREYQGRVEDGMAMKLMTVRAIFDYHHTGVMKLDGGVEDKRA